jgi:signal transduction histidine kinase
MNPDLLRGMRLFQELPDETVARIAADAEPLAIKAGEVLMEQGSPPDAMYVVVEGELEISTHDGDREVLLNVCGRGEPLGEMSVLSSRPRSATVRALQDSKLFVIRDTVFNELMSNPATSRMLLRTVMVRMEGQEAMLRQQEKLAGLGQITAGLMHELNNPAAAVRRATSQLRDALLHWQDLNAELERVGGDHHATVLQKLRDEVGQRASAPPPLDPIERSDREDAMQEWLENLGVDEAWELASSLVGLGWSPDELAAVSGRLDPSLQPTLIQWLATSGQLFRLADEASRGSEAISELVASVKAYSRNDEAPVQQVDISEGLESTIVMLRHKLSAGIRIVRDYHPVPKVEAYPSQLNQVWTNLIDNAIDAMGEAGTLTVRTRATDDRVIVEIADDGPGIPPDQLSRVFDPFYSTKPPGKGTGLGLSTVHTIVTKRHRGTIDVDSSPGQTVFRVVLPLLPDREA